MSILDNIKVIAFDADDTLWVNEPYFQETEHKFVSLLEDFMPHHSIKNELLKTEIKNLPYYGYGVKGFMLSMIETTLQVSDNHIDPVAISKIIAYGKELLDKPIDLLEGVVDVLEFFQGKYRLVMATKGDLLDQERKLKKSGLERYFHHIEIMSEKAEPEYNKLIKHLDIVPDEFLMIGNSLKSDILPVVKIGGHGIHVPYHTTWALETIDYHFEHPNFRHVNHIKEILTIL